MGYFSAQQAEQADENRQEDTGEYEYYCYVEEMKAMRIDEEYPQYLEVLANDLNGSSVTLMMEFN